MIYVDVFCGFYRLGPGEMLSVGAVEVKKSLNKELKEAAASRRPYAELVQQSISVLPRKSFSKGEPPSRTKALLSLH